MDFLHSKYINSYPVPQEEVMIRQRLELQNIVPTTQKWNQEILEVDSVTELLCVNEVKHKQPHISRNKDEYEQVKVVTKVVSEITTPLASLGLSPRSPQVPRCKISLESK